MLHREQEFDVARALAIIAMIIVNFKTVMGATTGSPLLIQLSSLLEGRASALFVMLAGVGVTFLTNKARHEGGKLGLAKARVSLLKRGALLVALGLAFTPIWPADILHFYGFYFLIAAAVFTRSDTQLLYGASILMLTFVMLLLFVDYDKHWHWESLEYQNFWSLDGLIRHTFFNGFHPVFPWAAFLVAGMWIGRQNVACAQVRGRLFLLSLLVFVVIELAMYSIRTWMLSNGTSIMSSEDISILFSTSVLPPMPTYVLSAFCTSLMTILACIHLCEKRAENQFIRCLAKTGQLSLTLYVAHVLLGMGLLEYLGLLENSSIGLALISALVFSLAGILFSVAWLKYFRLGPMESVFRAVVRR